VTLIDSNVILDVVTNDPQWAAWSQLQLERASVAGPLVINDIVYAEVSSRFEFIEDLDAVLADIGIRLEPMPRAGLFLAAKAYLRYRAGGGTRTGVLSAFFVGAHAAADGLVLLTRDRARYRNYFPAIRMIVPDPF
jgi:predicted nucleic acid-binding protein